MSQAYKLACGCIVERSSERILKQCACCAAEFSERHERAVEDRHLIPRTAAPSRVPEDVQ
jgi:hypothetical protein